MRDPPDKCRNLRSRSDDECSHAEERKDLGDDQPDVHACVVESKVESGWESGLSRDGVLGETTDEADDELPVHRRCRYRSEEE